MPQYRIPTISVQRPTPPSRGGSPAAVRRMRQRSAGVPPLIVKADIWRSARSDQRLILRDTAQTRKEEMHFFTDEFRHPFFHTNNLWFDLEVLDRTLRERNSVLGLPLIKNEKTVDPADPSSPKVIQIETAMGAAVEVFEGATAIGVGRDRFVPVKTTSDLLVLRSDAYELEAERTAQQGGRPDACCRS